MKVVRSASRTGRLYRQEMFLVLIFTRGRVDPRTMVRSEGYVTEKSSDTTGNRSRDRPLLYYIHSINAMTIIIIIIIIIISYLSCSWATCWPVPVSRIQKSLQRSAMIPSASWRIVFHYPG